jgi:putative membrane protein
MEPINESRLVQQHLANERTYLAWIRTAIALVGLGFLSAGIVYKSVVYSDFGSIIAAIVGVSAVILGGGLMGMATRDYMRKRDEINHNRFRSSTSLIRMIFVSLTVIVLLLVVLVFVMLFS